MPLAQIICFVKDPQEKNVPLMANLLVNLLQLDIYSVDCIKDYLTFAAFMQNYSFDSDIKFMCSFDISNCLRVSR